MKECTIEAPVGYKIKSSENVDGKMVITFEEIKKENVFPKTLYETIPYIPDMLY